MVKKYLESIKTSLDALPLEKIEKIAGILYRAYKSNKKIILMGNGGSAATATHFVCDLAKGTAVLGKKRFKALGLCDSMPMVTAYANDCGYEYIFSEQLKNLAEKGDVVICISASGNSKNVLNAVMVAKKQSAITIGLTGFQGGKLKKMVSECIVVPGDNMEQIEDIHLIILHVLKLILKAKI
jgi:D-sedoheptulose 7-phosphate isomerase